MMKSEEKTLIYTKLLKNETTKVLYQWTYVEDVDDDPRRRYTINILEIIVES